MKCCNLFILPLLSLFCACHQNSPQQNTQVPVAAKKPLIQTGRLKHEVSSDTLLVASTCAVITQADTAVINNQKRRFGDDFYVGSDDDVYYSSISEEFLKGKNIKVIYPNDKVKYLKFIKSNGSSNVLKLDTLPGIFNLYLFKPSANAHHADITAIEDEYKRYFIQKK
jgi:hypothetical protein